MRRDENRSPWAMTSLFRSIMASTRCGRLRTFRSLGTRISIYPDLINALVLIKMAAALANCELHRLDLERSEAIISAVKKWLLMHINL